MNLRVYAIWTIVSLALFSCSSKQGNPQDTDNAEVLSVDSDSTYSIDDTLSLGDLRLRVLNVKVDPRDVAYDTLLDKAAAIKNGYGKIYENNLNERNFDLCTVSVTLYNTSSTDSIDLPYTELEVDKNADKSVVVCFFYDAETNEDLFDTKIAPGQTIKGYYQLVAIDVPQNLNFLYYTSDKNDRLSKKVFFKDTFVKQLNTAK